MAEKSNSGAAGELLTRALRDLDLQGETLAAAYVQQALDILKARLQ